MSWRKFLNDVVSPPEETLYSPEAATAAVQRVVLRDLNERLRDMCRETLAHRGDKDEQLGP